MSASRGEFSSRLGFILAAAGSAVGLGNIWGFPTNAASNGGAAFLLVYLVMAFCLAYPVLMAELIIGRHAKSHPVSALRGLSGNPVLSRLGATTGYVGIITVSLILGFYGILAGWLLSNAVGSAAELVGMSGAATWLESMSVERSLLFTALMMLLTVGIIVGGVHDGIEKWCSRLMPSLILLLIGMIVYVLTLDGAGDGVRAYLVPDWGAISDPQLLVTAMGQAFFSMSLGVGSMLLYASYVPDKGNLVSLGRSVTLMDVGIAVLAGMLIIPAMYVAQFNGVQIFDAAGGLIAGDALIFQVLPALFDAMGGAGSAVSLAFFILMTIAALTSTISMLEVPVAYAVEAHDITRKRATVIMSAVIFLISVVLIFNFGLLFSLVADIATEYSQPLLGLMLCLFGGWVMHRSTVLEELKKTDAAAENHLFWKIWPPYVRYVCPAAIILVFVNKMFLS